jgi:hypothetical protein
MTRVIIENSEKIKKELSSRLQKNREGEEQ